MDLDGDNYWTVRERWGGGRLREREVEEGVRTLQVKRGSILNFGGTAP